MRDRRRLPSGEEEILKMELSPSRLNPDADFFFIIIFSLLFFGYYLVKNSISDSYLELVQVSGNDNCVGLGFT